MELIRLKGVTKQYKKKNILRDVNLTLEAGDVLGVIGQSGSGKTTLLNLIIGFIEPSKGEVVYFSKVEGKEKDLNDNLHRIKRHFGFTPQHNSFYPKLTVKENLIHFGKLYKIDKKTLEHNINNLLEFTKLSHHKKKLAEHLSGGMQKRLDISCSLVHKPKLLVLDEPTADLDPILQKEILRLLDEVSRQGVTIVIASHNLGNIEKICNKVAIVHKGKVHSHGLIEDVKKPYLKDHLTINVQSGKEKEQLLEKIKDLHFKKIVDKGHSLVIYPETLGKTMDSLMSVIKEDNLNLHDLDLRKPSLHEVFEKIAQEEDVIGE
ncbi:ABC transporter ATP-binding protein [Candidatus Woesearchaeota archaeon]|nr:ABC transporter ATP-binding protein [Candidatus Woesearchaeota archaeon]MBT4110376.1 ABC transporter ATP-binding protein [Candidatus Woesearchaeota archaeon]MBT4336100.1 ABC transporter ATP-binding protein [Candidatus Woesearchaeota archaeon]MBT4468921.1 ABC transporter ATP-binding protein [Candidatus Woesearchaeota archaeon]MBT6744760.1 ABC transporter ATP-binding protein [Candidatus Woesearchaeota archaeon]